MKFKEALNEVKISQFIQKLKQGDKRVFDTRFVASLSSDDTEKPLTYKEVIAIMNQNKVTLTPNLTSHIKTLTANAEAQKSVADVAAAERLKKQQMVKGSGVRDAMSKTRIAT